MIPTPRSFRSHDGYARWSRWAEWPLVALGLTFLVVLILPLAVPLTATERETLDAANLAIWAAFVVDYVARLYLALDRRHYVRTHVLDLIVIVVPFLRPFRLLRLFAIVVSTGRRAGGLVVRRVTIYAIALSLIIMAVGAVLAYDAERKVAGSNINNLGDAVWWAFTTMTTVGGGEFYPVTQVGRATAGVLMITGVALVGTVTAAVASWFVNVVRNAEHAPTDARAAQERADLHAHLAAISASLDELANEVATLRAARS